jgi:hypothetical protein
MHDTRNKVIIAILSVLFVIATVVAIVFFVKNKESNEVLEITEQEYKKKIDSLVNEPKINEEATKTESTITEKVVEKNVEVAKIISFDRSKTKNVRDGVVYGDITQVVSSPIATITTNGEVTITYYNSDMTSKSYKIEGLDKKAIEVLAGSIGDGGSDRIVILLEDGTVAYIKNNLSSESASLKIEGKIEGLTNAVKILCCRTSRKEGAQVRNIGLTFIAIDKNGYFYDVGMLT